MTLRMQSFTKLATGFFQAIITLVFSKGDIICNTLITTFKEKEPDLSVLEEKSSRKQTWISFQ